QPTVDAGVCIENVVSVLGNEADDVPGNNTDTAESCATALEQDFGDAPASYGTALADDGARHRLPDYDADASVATPMLGAAVTAEDDGQPDAAAAADIGDDGVLFNPGLGYDTPTLRTGL